MRSRAQQIAIILRGLKKKGSIKKGGGLRATIKKLRNAGHRASDFRTLYHGTSTAAANVIEANGLETRYIGSGRKARAVVHGGSRRVAQAYAGQYPGLNFLRIGKPGKLIKYRAPKNKTTYDKVGYGHPEYRTRVPIPTDTIRVLTPTGRTRKTKKK
jgi:hypothetical protein